MKKFILLGLVFLFLAGCKNTLDTSQNLQTPTRKVIFTNEEPEDMNTTDSDALEQINDVYSKDKNSVYYDETKIESADSQTFEALLNNYAKDKNAVYYEEKKIEGADPETFNDVGLWYGHASDKNYNYSYGIRLTEEEFLENRDKAIQR